MMVTLLARKHFDRGRQFELQDRLAEAVEAYRAACALEPELADPYFACARLEAGQGRHEEALVLLDKALAHEPDDPQIIEWRAYVYGRLRRYEEALRDYRRVLDDGETQVRVNLGRMLLALGRYEEAEEALRHSDDPSALPLLEALPRYREFDGRDRLDDHRAVRYLFGGTLLLGTLGDGGLELGHTRYLYLSPRHLAVTIRRFLRLAGARGWSFDAVGGDGVHHGPVAEAVARLLDVPLRTRPASGRVLLCSAVVAGADEAISLSAPWRSAGAQIMHLAMGLVPGGDPGPEEPDMVGFANRCAVPWYRVEPWSRLVPDDDADEEEAERPGFRVGPPVVDFNRARLVDELVATCRGDLRDPFADEVLGYYLDRHPQVRAFRWDS